MKFDVSRFKKVKANDKETTLLHPHGHMITLNHENIRPEMKKVLDALPMYDGGEVPEEQPTQEQTTGGNREPGSVIDDFKKAAKKTGQAAKNYLSKTDLYQQSAAKKISNFHDYDDHFNVAAAYAGEPVDLLKSQAYQESGFNPKKVSSSGAKGVMQITDVTWKEIKQRLNAQYNREAVAAKKENRKINPEIEYLYKNIGDNPYDPKSNILASGYYINSIKKQSGFQNTSDWLRAYNMGPHAYREAVSGARHLPTETKEYPEKILGYYSKLNPNFSPSEKFQAPTTPTPLKKFGEQPQLTDDEIFKKNASEMQPWERSQYAPESVNQQQAGGYPKASYFGPEGKATYRGPSQPQYPFEPQQVSSEMQPWEASQYAGSYGPSSIESTQREPTPMPNVSPPQGVTSQAQPAPTEPTPRPNQAPANYKPAEPQPAVSRQQAAQQQPSGAMTFNQMPGISQAPQTKAQQQTGAPGGEPAGATDRFGFGALQTEMEQARAQGLQGALMPGQAYEQYAKDAQDVLRQRNQEYKALWDRTNQYKTDYQNEIKNTAAKIQQVDPTRWLHNNVKTVPQKITTAIGLLLSGMGAGGGGVNLAAKWINDQIDRDIDAQKANITTQQNLMRVYNDHFRNLTDSEQMTRAVMQEYYAGLIEQQANKLTSKVKQAEGLRAAADFRMKAAAEIQNIAQRGAMMDYTMGVMGGVNAQAPEGKIRALETVGMIPKERADKMYKDIQEYRANTSKIQEFESAFKEVARLSYEKARFANPVQFKQRIDFLRAQLLGPLSRDLAGKFTEFEAKNLENILPQYIDSDETVKFKTDKFMKMLQNIYAMPGFMPNYPELNAYGIKLSPYTQQPMRQEAPAGYMGR